MNRQRRQLPTPQTLTNAAAQYLARYASSEGSLRRILDTRIRRALADNPEAKDDESILVPLRQTIDQLIEKYKKMGVLNDMAYAEAKIRSLRRRGASQRAIIQRLGTQGIAKPLLTDLLNDTAEGASRDEIELEAARAFIRRRRIGPYRAHASGEDERRKDLAALARAGFSIDIAKKALDGGPVLMETQV